MYKKNITYVDYDGNTRTEEHCFNLNQTELKEMELNTPGGFGAKVEKIIAALDMPEIYAIFKDIVSKSYGVKSPDGRKLVKSPEVFLEFSQTEAYNVFMEEITSNAEAAATFINAIIPNVQKAENAPAQNLNTH